MKEEEEKEEEKEALTSPLSNRELSHESRSFLFFCSSVKGNSLQRNMKE